MKNQRIIGYFFKRYNIFDPMQKYYYKYLPKQYQIYRLSMKIILFDFPCVGYIHTMCFIYKILAHTHTGNCILATNDKRLLFYVKYVPRAPLDDYYRCSIAQPPTPFQHVTLSI